MLDGDTAVSMLARLALLKVLLVRVSINRLIKVSIARLIKVSITRLITRPSAHSVT